MLGTSGSQVIKEWPEESREAAQLVIDAHGEPAEVAPSFLVWYDIGACKRVVAARTFYQHSFPVPHIDAVESVIDYRVPPEHIAEVARFDGSVTVERTAGEVSARCHDEQANFLALNLMHDIVTGARTAEDARRYYAKEFLDYRRKRPTPYMQQLRFEPGGAGAPDPDERVISDQDLEQAAWEGEESRAADSEEGQDE